jgi:hypothetical protein
MGAEGTMWCSFSLKNDKNESRISCEVIRGAVLKIPLNVTRKRKLRKKCQRGAKITFLTNSWEIKGGFLFLARPWTGS